jgi:hypothetical protein
MFFLGWGVLARFRPERPNSHSRVTGDEQHRQILLDLAKQWTQAALAAERLLALVDGGAPLAPKSKH